MAILSHYSGCSGPWIRHGINPWCPEFISGLTLLLSPPLRRLHYNFSWGTRIRTWIRSFKGSCPTIRRSPNRNYNVSLFSKYDFNLSFLKTSRPYNLCCATNCPRLFGGSPMRRLPLDDPAAQHRTESRNFLPCPDFKNISLFRASLNVAKFSL